MQRVSGPHACISELTFDRACAGELSPGAQRELDHHLTVCVSCSLRFQVLCRQRDELLRKAPDWDAFTQLHKAGARRRSPKARYLVLGLAAASILGVITTSLPSTQQVDRARLKGASSIGFYVRRDAHVTRGASGDSVFPADELRFSYTSDRRQQFALLYADSHTSSIYYPLTGTTIQIEPGRDLPLDFGVALDEQLGTERALGLFCERPQQLEPLRAQLQQLGSLRAPAGCYVDEIILHKRAR